LCNGEVIPRSPSAETWIEFGHRATSGIALALVAGLVIGAWRSFPAGHRVRAAAGAAAFFLAAEALVGAGLVLLQHVATDASAARAAWMAGHLANTFFLVGALALTAWWASVREESNPADGAIGIPRRALAWALCAVLVLGMTGAVTALGDTLLRASVATDSLVVGLRVCHPVLALIAAPLVFGLSARVRRATTSATRRLATALGLAYASQLVLGALNVWLQAPVALQLVHLLASDGIWILLVLLAASLWGSAAGNSVRAPQLSCATTATET